jgi:hypothetical protein
MLLGLASLVILGFEFRRIYDHILLSQIWDSPIWSKLKLLYDWRSVWLVNRYYFLSEGCYLKVVILFLWGALSDERTGLQFAVQSLNGPSRADSVTMLYCIIWDSPTWRVRFPYLYPPGTGCPSYTPEHWISFTSLLTIRSAFVEVFQHTSTGIPNLEGYVLVFISPKEQGGPVIPPRHGLRLLIYII